MLLPEWNGVDNMPPKLCKCINPSPLVKKYEFEKMQSGYKYTCKECGLLIKWSDKNEKS